MESINQEYKIEPKVKSNFRNFVGATLIGLGVATLPIHCSEKVYNELINIPYDGKNPENTIFSSLLGYDRYSLCNRRNDWNKGDGISLWDCGSTIVIPYDKNDKLKYDNISSVIAEYSGGLEVTLSLSLFGIGALTRKKSK